VIGKKYFFVRWNLFNVKKSKACFLKKYKSQDDKKRKQDRERIFKNVAKETWHSYASLLGNGPNHKIGCITDVGIGTHKYGTDGYGSEIRSLLDNQFGHRISFRRAGVEFPDDAVQKREISWRIIQKLDRIPTAQK